MSVGWSGNPAIKRGARGKSREDCTRSLLPCACPGSPRTHGRRQQPLGDERSRRGHLPLAQLSGARHSPRRRARYRRRGGRAAPCRDGRRAERQRGEAGYGHAGWGNPSCCQVLPCRAVPRVCDPLPEPTAGRGWQCAPERSPPLPAAGAGGGKQKSARCGCCAAPGARPSPDLEPSWLLLKRCNSRSRCAGGVLVEVSEGIGTVSALSIPPPGLHLQHPLLALLGTCRALHFQISLRPSLAEQQLRSWPSENLRGGRQAEKRESSKA